MSGMTSRAAAAATTALVGILSGTLGLWASGFPTRWTLVCLGGVLAATPFVLAAIRGRFDIFEPIYLFCVSFSVLFVARPAYDIAAGLPDSNGYSVSQGYDGALLAGVVGISCFIVGYYSRFGPDLGRAI